MPKNNYKPYSSSTNRSRTINDKKLSNTAVLNKLKKVKDKEKKLENTTRIRIDNSRLNDAESLDTSFLEGRLDKKVRDNVKAKEKLLKERKQVMFDFEIIKWVFFSLAFICIIVLGVIYLKNSPLFKIDDSDVSDIKKEEKKNIDTEETLDSNYLFVGDFYIDKMVLKDADYHYSKSFKEDLTTESLKDDLKNMIYIFNPSDVFIQVGINDLDKNVEIDDLIDNYSEIIDGIKDKRSYANIYIMSLYPINKDVEEFDSHIINEEIDNEDITKLNKELKKLADKKKVNYIDLYSLVSKDDKLDDDYTDNGVYLNDDGYDKVFNKIIEYLDDAV